jgi:putative transposase
MTHPWRSSGSKRTIWWNYEPSEQVIIYLEDMRNAIHQGVMKAGELMRRNGKIPTPIDLRKEMKGWFDSRYDYAKHHINPVCRTSVAILRSFRKNSKNKKYPEVKKLSMRLDSELVKIVGDSIRITIRPGEYEIIPISKKNKKLADYSRYKISEVLITDHAVSVSFAIPGEKQTGNEITGMDLNFKTLDSTTMDTRTGGITHVETIPMGGIVRIQNDFSRRRKEIQKHVRNPQKRNRKLEQTRGRQRRRIKDELHKKSTAMVRDHPDTSFVFEDLTGIRKSGEDKGKKFRTYLNRWPYSMFQKMVEYKSKNKTMYVDPRGTSSECPVCGEKLKHPAWKISRCVNCDQDYDRDRLASLAITLRGLDLCGDPFPVSASASWQSMKNEYLYPGHVPDMPEAGRTETTYAANELVHNNA